VVVVCPKCRIKLKVNDARLTPQGSRFKCPKCGTVLVVKKPVVQEKRTLNERKVLVAHSSPAVVDTIYDILEKEGYTVVTSSDGIDAMVRALKELPSLVIIEVALPKIYGFEVCKKLKSRPETKHIGVVLVPSIYDKTKYRRDPVSLYGADDYIEEHEISTKLMASIERIKSKTTQPAPEKPHPQPTTAVPATPEIKPVEKKIEEPPMEPAPALKPAEEDVTDEFTEKAKRLARTIISDIYLYNSAKVDNAVRHGNFYAVFASEVREGLKLYENRIPKETRAKADFFREAIDNFLSAKKKSLS
jgi:predicted Zn finger-like uncharacterized protein